MAEYSVHKYYKEYVLSSFLFMHLAVKLCIIIVNCLDVHNIFVSNHVVTSFIL
jgi:hypothetical protein